MDIWASYGWLCRSQWVSEANPPKLVKPEDVQKHCNEQTYKRLSGAPSRANAAVIPYAKTSANAGVRGNAATNKPVSPAQCDPGRKNREERKVVDEREISMDYVAIPASYEHPGIEPTPKLLQAGWLSTMTMYQKRVHSSLPPAPSPTRSAAGIEPTLPGTRHPCTTSMLR